MGQLKTLIWDAIFDAPGLVATFDALLGYEYSPAARRTLCQLHNVSPEAFSVMLRTYSTGHSIKHLFRFARDGWDILFEIPELRRILDSEKDEPRLDAVTLLQRRTRFSLTKQEMVNALNAHADIWSRP